MTRGSQPNASTRDRRHTLSPSAHDLAVGAGLALAAFLAVLPLILHGCSCGHDQVFHIQGWLDAAQQLRHAHYPRWSFTSAWNAGEPRFLFYPPLSWLLGATLTLIFPATIAPTLYIFIALLLSGLTFHKLASHFARPNAPLIASAFYLANPYMLFNAFERSAYAELLAAAWIPLLLLAILRPRPTIRGIALPIALLWLTNAPAAVMGCYTLALLATLRLLTSLIQYKNLPSRPECSGVEESLHSFHLGDLRTASPTPLWLAIISIAGTILGLALPAFYLFPAAYERRLVQVTMAIIPGMRPQDNFLFTHTADPGHNVVNLQISLLALTLLGLTYAALIALFLLRKRAANRSIPNASALAFLFVIPGRTLLLSLPLLATVLTFLLFPPSTLLWLDVPELAFLQLPWRLLTILTPVLSLTLALLFSYEVRTPPAAEDPSPLPIRPHRTGGLAITLTFAATLLLPVMLGVIAYHLYSQYCQPNDLPATIAHDLATHHGFPPTDEYTPNHADNDILRTDNPAYWLLPATANPNTPAPNTTPTATELNPSINTDDGPVPLAQTVSTLAPRKLTLNLLSPSILVLNLRAYPNWRITNERTPNLPSHLDRDDGLIAILVPAGSSTIDITWHRTTDQTLGLILSALALITFALTYRRAT